MASALLHRYNLLPVKPDPPQTLITRVSAAAAGKPRIDAASPQPRRAAPTGVRARPASAGRIRPSGARWAATPLSAETGSPGRAHRRKTLVDQLTERLRVAEVARTAAATTGAELPGPSPKEIEAMSRPFDAEPSKAMAASAASPQSALRVHTAAAASMAGMYDSLHRALHKAVNRIDARLSLTDRWRALIRYIESFNQDLIPAAWCADSVALAAHLPQELKETGSGPAYVLAELLDLLVTLRPELTDVCDQVAGAVVSLSENLFTATAKRRRVSVAPCMPLSPKGRRSLGTEQLMRQLQEAEMARSAAPAALRRALAHSDNHYLRIVFKSWRREIQIGKDEAKASATLRDLVAARSQLSQLRMRSEVLKADADFYNQQWQQARRDVEQANTERSLRVAELKVELGHIKERANELEREAVARGAEAEGLQSLLDDTVFQDLEMGCPGEAMLQAELLDVVDMWLDEVTSREMSVPVLSPRGRRQEHTGDLRPGLSVLLAHWVNRCLRTHVNGAEYRLDPQLGFVDVHKELGAIMLCTHRMAPNLVTDSDVQKFMRTLDNSEKASLVLTALREVGVDTGVTPSLMCVDDGFGFARVLTLTSLVLRGLDPPHSSDESRRMRWVADDEAVKLCSVGAAAFDDSDSTSTPRALKNPWQGDPPPGRRMRVREWAELRQEADTRLRRLSDARKAVLAAVRLETLRMSQAAESESMTAGERRDRKLYTTVSPASSGFLYATMQEARNTKDLPPLRVSEDESYATVQQCFNVHFRHLRRVYRYYACSDSRRAAHPSAKQTAGMRMTRVEFERFVEDVGLKYVGTPEVERQLEMQLSAQGGVLSPEGFADAVVKLAALPFADGADLCESGGERVAMLIDDQISHNADYVALAEFKAACHKEHTEAVLRDYRPQLQKIFVHYAAGKETSDACEQSAKELREISFREFKQLMEDVGAVSETCSNYAMHQVFTKMQDDYDLALSFSEFWEVLCGVATLKNPAPYLPLHTRVRRFLDHSFLPPLRHRGMQLKPVKKAAVAQKVMYARNVAALLRPQSAQNALDKLTAASSSKPEKATPNPFSALSVMAGPRSRASSRASVSALSAVSLSDAGRPDEQESTKDGQSPETNTAGRRTPVFDALAPAQDATPTPSPLRHRTGTLGVSPGRPRSLSRTSTGAVTKRLRAGTVGRKRSHSRVDGL
eukprot:TRINITY_DN2778_c0_g1_i1.p1 TRINITY_DN2778_c0_g1~~TRINITY_DN2778_c0_g1_i1.p1  ORF type:complete len:1203 (+),score=227.28 TRINITY_DN2778_c0_g1_i1:54-3611(+)